MIFRTSGNRRGGHDGNFPKMIFLSLIIHLIVIAALIVSIPTTSRRLTFGTAYSVQLVGAEAALPSREPSLLKDFIQQTEPPEAIVIKHKISSIYSPPAKAQRETQKTTVERPSVNVRQPEKSPAGVGESGTAVADSAAGPKLSDAEMSSQTNEYIAMVWARIKQNWTMPQPLMPDTNITAVIDVRLSRSGALEHAAFEKRSGNRYFDESALRAVKKSAPFPPLPFWVRDNSIAIGIRFHSTELP